MTIGESVTIGKMKRLHDAHDEARALWVATFTEAFKRGESNYDGLAGAVNLADGSVTAYLKAVSTIEENREAIEKAEEGFKP